MKNQYDLIVLGLARFDTPYSSTVYSLSRELAKNHRVFFIDNPFTIKDFFALIKTDYIKIRFKALLTGKNYYRRLKNAPENLIILTPRLTIPINWLPRGMVYNFLSRRNDQIILKTVKKAIQDFDIKQAVYINSFNPFYLKTLSKQKLPVQLNIYHVVDDISQALYVAKHGVNEEKKTIAKTDFVLATSLELKKLKSGYGKAVHYLPNAADISLFRKAYETTLPFPDDLLPYKGKDIICYMGNIKDRDDFPLLRKIAMHYHDKILLLIGPVNTHEHIREGLDKIANIVFLGRKPLEALPNYLQYVSCTIIPFKFSTLTRSIYPLKVNEYLASGKPVVTTGFSEDILNFKDVVYVANEHNAFIDAIEKAIKEDNDTKRNARLKVADQNTWSARAEQLKKIIENEFEKSNKNTEMEA